MSPTFSLTRYVIWTRRRAKRELFPIRARSMLHVLCPCSRRSAQQRSTELRTTDHDVGRDRVEPVLTHEAN